jgi:hypothetical protein
MQPKFFNSIWEKLYKKIFGVKKILRDIMLSFLAEGGVGPYSYRWASNI